ncbi:MULTISPECIES: hypothetical protein [Actinomadura]|uniref:Uncharacterized protein n=1 Tax=Actinomadura litoris TaxID=2678616 RepID=A0A7K1L9U6_9ACTN|nr:MULTISPECIES: hypothetical protein [Actinomadura]MBT2207225.1 hypothetical protein [Actinomadura sp. NEAU-AAG7]MUN41093.1 hypothetical protein [Actinomadura litoris]
MIDDAGPRGTRRSVASMFVTAASLALPLALLAGAVYLLVFAVEEGGATRDAAAGRGRPGVLLAEKWRCARRCSWYGRFTPQTGNEVRYGVELRGADDGAVKAGNRLPGRDVGRFVQADGGKGEWGSTIGAAVGTFLLLAFAVGSLVAFFAGRDTAPRRRSVT